MCPEAIIDAALLGSLKANIHRISDKSLTRLCDAAGLTWSIERDRFGNDWDGYDCDTYRYDLKGSKASCVEEFETDISDYATAEYLLREKIIEVLEQQIDGEEVSASGLMDALLCASRVA